MGFKSNQPEACTPRLLRMGPSRISGSVEQVDTDSKMLKVSDVFLFVSVDRCTYFMHSTHLLCRIVVQCRKYNKEWNCAKVDRDWHDTTKKTWLREWVAIDFHSKQLLIGELLYYCKSRFKLQCRFCLTTYILILIEEFEQYFMHHRSWPLLQLSTRQGHVFYN